MPGPVPKRSTERRRRNKPETPTDTVSVPAAPVEAPPADPDWHPVAAGWYDALSTSGQATYYEPSDWAAARYVATVMTTNLNASKFSAQLFASVWTAMTDLLTTEGARRRARMEIERDTDQGEPAGVTALADYRDALGG